MFGRGSSTTWEQNARKITFDEQIYFKKERSNKTWPPLIMESNACKPMRTFLYFHQSSRSWWARIFTGISTFCSGCNINQKFHRKNDWLSFNLWVLIWFKVILMHDALSNFSPSRQIKTGFKNRNKIFMKFSCFSNLRYTEQTAREMKILLSEWIVIYSIAGTNQVWTCLGFIGWSSSCYLFDYQMKWIMKWKSNKFENVAIFFWSFSFRFWTSGDLSRCEEKRLKLLSQEFY